MDPDLSALSAGLEAQRRLMVFTSPLLPDHGACLNLVGVRHYCSEQHTHTHTHVHGEPGTALLSWPAVSRIIIRVQRVRQSQNRFRSASSIKSFSNI